MMRRLLRPLLAILIAFALIGPLAAQAAAPMPCHGECFSLTAHQADPGQFPTPCKSMATVCMTALGCVATVNLPDYQSVAATRLSWAPVTYRADTRVIDGLSLAPDLGPPIAI
jgi:hypothetical protein